jgi:hypothetical protein
MFRRVDRRSLVRPQTAYGEWLLSQILNDGRDVDASGLSPEQHFTICQGVFEAAINRRFSPGTDVSTLNEFVMWIYDRVQRLTPIDYSHPIDAIRPIDAEALIREALGEEVDTKGISPGERMWFEWLAIVFVVDDLKLPEQDVISIIVQGERTAQSRGYQLK